LEFSPGAMYGSGLTVVRATLNNDTPISG
jgi:hypothetical protein